MDSAQRHVANARGQDHEFRQHRKITDSLLIDMLHKMVINSEKYKINDLQC